MSSKKYFGLGTLVLAASLCGNSNAATITSQVIGGPNEPTVKLTQSSGTEGWDFGKDADFIPINDLAINYFSRTSIPGHEKLKYDVRTMDSFTTFNTEIGSVGLTGILNSTLINTITNTDHVFDSKNIFLKLYNSDQTDLTIYNVKDPTAASIPLQISNLTTTSYLADYSFTTTGTSLDIGNFSGNNLSVKPNTNITAGSIVCTTLSIGSPSGLSGIVPEPETKTLLALAGVSLASYGLYSMKKGREY